MKTIITGDGWQDYIVSHEVEVVRIGGNPKFIDEANGIAEHKGNVTSIVFYEDEYSDGGKTGNAKRIELNTKTILILADKIREINSTVSNHTYKKETDDLPW